MILGKVRKIVVFGTDDLARGCLFVGSNLIKADFYAECGCKGNHELNNAMQKQRKNAISFCSWLPREVPVAICRLISIRFRKKRQPRASGAKKKTTFFRYHKDLAVETNKLAPIRLRVPGRVQFSRLPFGLIWDIKNLPPSK